MSGGELVADVDVAVVGGGIVGLALLRMLSIVGLRAVLLEAGDELLTGASGGNSAILHEPVEEDGDANPIELWCVQQGSRRARGLLRALGVTAPFWRPCGALVVAWRDDELPGLAELQRRADANGVSPPVQRLDADQLYRLEPHLAAGALAALLVPGEAVIDSWLLASLFAVQALSLGRHNVSIVRRFRVHTAVRQQLRRTTTTTILNNDYYDNSEQQQQQFGGWQLCAEDGRRVAATLVINAAGLYADHVEALRGGDVGFEIRPRRGQFLVFQAPDRPLLQRVVYPVPSKTTKGILATPTVHGLVFVGPTASEQQSRTDRSVDAAESARLHAAAARLCPELPRLCPVAGEYVGIRTATQHTDYLLCARPLDSWITCAGVRSTGATGSLGVAEYVRRFCLPVFFPAARLAPVHSDAHVEQNARAVAQSLVAAVQRHTDGTVHLPSPAFRTKVTHPLSRLGLLARL